MSFETQAHILYEFLCLFADRPITALSLGLPVAAHAEHTGSSNSKSLSPQQVEAFQENLRLPGAPYTFIGTACMNPNGFPARLNVADELKLERQERISTKTYMEDAGRAAIGVFPPNTRGIRNAQLGRSEERWGFNVYSFPSTDGNGGSMDRVTVRPNGSACIVYDGLNGSPLHPPALVRYTTPEAK